MKVTDRTVELIKRHEGLRLDAYGDPVGVWTIGYGHSERAPTPPKPYPGMSITEQEAEDILRRDLNFFADRLRPMLPEDTPPNVFGACLSLAFNIGIGAFENSTCRQRLLAGDREGAAEALRWWDKAGGKILPGLVRRRREEADLMLSEPQPEQEPAHQKPASPDTPSVAPGVGIAALAAAGALVLIIIGVIT